MPSLTFPRVLRTVNKTFSIIVFSFKFGGNEVTNLLSEDAIRILSSAASNYYCRYSKQVEIFRRSKRIPDGLSMSCFVWLKSYWHRPILLGSYDLGRIPQLS